MTVIRLILYIKICISNITLIGYYIKIRIKEYNIDYFCVLKNKLV